MIYASSPHPFFKTGHIKNHFWNKNRTWSEQRVGKFYKVIVAIKTITYKSRTGRTPQRPYYIYVCVRMCVLSFYIWFLWKIACSTCSAIEKIILFAGSFRRFWWVLPVLKKKRAICG